LLAAAIASIVVDGCAPLSEQDNSGVDYPYKKELTQEQLRKLDVEFFNVFRPRLENPGMRERRQTIADIARSGFEVAWLADNLFVFDWFAIPQLDAGYERYFVRLKYLADAGNASAQCLMGDLLGNYEVHHNTPPGQSDVSAEEYRARASDSGHPYCLHHRASNFLRTGQFELAYKTIRQCAEHGDAGCVGAIPIYYEYLYQKPMNLSMHYCFSYREYLLSGRSPTASSNLIMLENAFVLNDRSSRRELIERRERLRKSISPDTDCDTQFSSF
jgi:hypothetical protein